MLNITDIMSAIIALAVAILTTFVVPAIRRKMDAEYFDELLKWVKIAVKAAELIYKGTGMGKAKKQYVKEFLLSHGYELDEAELDAAIESAVLEMKESVKHEQAAG